MQRLEAPSTTPEQLQDLIIESEDVDQFLEDLAAYSSKILGDDVEVHCGVTLKRRKRRTTVASSGPQARKVDEIMLGVPIVLADGGGAALNFYSEEPDTFQPKTIELAESYAVQTSTALQLAIRVASRRRTSKLPWSRAPLSTSQWGSSWRKTAATRSRPSAS